MITKLLSFALICGIGMAFAGASGAPEAQEASPKPSNAAEAEKGEKASTPPPIAAIRDEDRGCLVDQASLDDLKKRREENEARAKELAAKETELKAKERAIDEELKKLKEVKEEIAKLTEAGKKENEEKVGKLVETFETMSPKAASQLLAVIDEGLAVVAMTRISTQRLAKIMNLMEPDKASRLSELMAGIVRAKTSPKKEIAMQKGGENDANHSNVGRNPSSGSAVPAAKPGAEKSENAGKGK